MHREPKYFRHRLLTILSIYCEQCSRQIPVLILFCFYLHKWKAGCSQLEIYIIDTSIGNVVYFAITLFLNWLPLIYISVRGIMYILFYNTFGKFHYSNTMLESIFSVEDRSIKDVDNTYLFNIYIYIYINTIYKHKWNQFNYSWIIRYNFVLSMPILWQSYLHDEQLLCMTNNFFA